MNQGEATATIIDYARDQAPEDKRVLKALKVLEKRYDVLRTRSERRRAVIPPDLFEEPLTLSRGAIVAELLGEECRCGRYKEERSSSCPHCYAKLRPDTRKALWLGVGKGYEQAYCRALRELGLPTSMENQVQGKLASAAAGYGQSVDGQARNGGDYDESCLLTDGVNAPALEAPHER
jgi:hypothetical protein